MRHRYWNLPPQVLCAFVVLAICGQRSAEAQPVPQQNVQFPQGFRAQPQLNVVTAQGPRGAVMLSNTPAGLTMPMGPAGVVFSRRNGLQLSVKTEWPGQYGYRPITVTIRSEKPATSDRTVEFRFTAGDWNISNGVSARQRFVLAQGQTEAKIQLLVPQINSWQRCYWELYVDGARDDEFAVNYVDVNSMRAASMGNATDVAAVGVSLDHAERYAATAGLGLAYSNTSATLDHIEPADLPVDWLGYTSLNVVVLPADGLEKLMDEHPRQAEALLRWVATGGNLWLIGAGARWQELADVERVLSAREERPVEESSGEADSNDDTDAASRQSKRLLPPGWRFAPLDNRAGEPAEGALVLAGYPVDEAAAEKERLKPTTADPRPDALTAMDPAMAATAPVDRNAPKTSAEWFAVRGWGLGAITAFRRNLHGSRELDNQEATRVVSQSLLAPRQQWGGRFGSVPNDSNVDFNDWLIPGVGMAPVGSFQVLITLFVLAIGPFTYWFLRRMGKLPMLVAIVPAAAIFTTLSLFAYGVLIDGVAARVRGRSVTILDQRSGECAAWGRYSYYAGIAPRAGMTVPVDQAMFPILPNWSSIFGFGGRQSMTDREVVWDDEQRLTRGWLASRTPTQYHAIAARKTPKQLELRPTAAGIRVTNRLGVEVVGAAIHDHDGKLYWCEGLPIDKGSSSRPSRQPKSRQRCDASSPRTFRKSLPATTAAKVTTATIALPSRTA